MKTLGIVLAAEPTAGGSFKYQHAVLHALLDISRESGEFEPVILVDEPSKLMSHAVHGRVLSFGGASIRPLMAVNGARKVQRVPVEK